MKNEAYVGLLRGINVGGHTIKMTDLKRVFEDCGGQNVATILASGNVIFSSDEKYPKTLSSRIEKTLEERFGYPIHTLIRTKEELEHLINSNPFKKIPITPNIRLYITFLPEKTQKKDIKDKRILHIGDDYVLSIVDLTQSHTTDLMMLLEKSFGKNITTRGWNTILKIGLVLHQ